jgi:hypothetical protein
MFLNVFLRRRDGLGSLPLVPVDSLGPKVDVNRQGVDLEFHDPDFHNLDGFLLDGFLLDGFLRDGSLFHPAEIDVTTKA